MDDVATVESTTASELLRRYPEVIEEISPRDLMRNPERPQNYWRGGQAGLDAIRLAMLCAQKPTAERILDLPSGHGRVLRYLRAEFPEAMISACDIDHEAVDFCAETFGVIPVYGHELPADVELEQYDLIWCGSLLTHLDAPKWPEFLDLFEPALTPGGLLVATFHGHHIAEILRDSPERDFYMPSEDARKQILDGYEREGFGFAEYPTSPETRALRSEPSSFGISLARPSWVWGLLEDRELQVVTFMEHRWGGQDVLGLLHPGTTLRIPYGFTDPEPS